jgi:hypothetical protein
MSGVDYTFTFIFMVLIQTPPPPQVYHAVMVKTPSSFCLKHSYRGIRFLSLYLVTNQHIREGRLGTE